MRDKQHYVRKKAYRSYNVDKHARHMILLGYLYYELNKFSLALWHSQNKKASWMSTVMYNKLRSLVKYILPLITENH